MAKKLRSGSSTYDNFLAGPQLVSLEGIEAVRADPHAWRMILTDYTMPGVTGIELARIVSGFAPGISIVLMTGTRAADLEERAREAGICRLLLKPFRPIEVAEALRDALETASR